MPGVGRGGRAGRPGPPGSEPSRRCDGRAGKAGTAVRAHPLALGFRAPGPCRCGLHAGRPVFPGGRRPVGRPAGRLPVLQRPGGRRCRAPAGRAGHPVGAAGGRACPHALPPAAARRRPALCGRGGDRASGAGALEEAAGAAARKRRLHRRDAGGGPALAVQPLPGTGVATDDRRPYGHGAVADDVGRPRHHGRLGQPSAGDPGFAGRPRTVPGRAGAVRPAAARRPSGPPRRRSAPIRPAAPSPGQRRFPVSR